MSLSTIIESALNMMIFKSIKIVQMFYEHQWSLRFIDRNQLFSFYMMPFPINQSYVSSRLVVMLGWATSQIYPRVCQSIFTTFIQPYLNSNLRAALQSASLYPYLFRREQSKTKYFVLPNWKKWSFLKYVRYLITCVQDT